MKNLLTIVALLVSLSGIAASVLREEMRCYFGLPSQSCPTAEKPSLPVSLPEKKSQQEKKVIKPVILPKSSQSRLQESIFPSDKGIAPPSSAATPENSGLPSDESPSRVTSDTTNPLEIPIESAQVLDSENEKISTPSYEYAEDGIPIPIEPYDSSEKD